MKKKKGNNSIDKTILAIGSIAIFILVAIVINVFCVTIFAYHIRSGTDFSYYVDSVSTYTSTVKATRGTIYDSNGIVIAKDETTYDIICYIDSNRKASKNKIAYVDDPVYTAQMLAPILNMDYTEILEHLTPSEYRYQVELGVNGRNLSEETKLQIEALELPGIEFRESSQRVYPQGSSLSPYLVGFAQSDENGTLVGKFGVESYLNDYLSGSDGKVSEQVSKDGYILQGMKSNDVEVQDGYDVYLTIDKSIDDAISTFLNNLMNAGLTSRGWSVVMEIDTGKILGYGQTNDFDPNTLQIDSYLNYLGDYGYEPGSTMKSIIYSACMEEGIYDGSVTYNSNKFYYATDDDGEPYRVSGNGQVDGVVNNVNYHEYGYVPLDTGLIESLNTATSTLLCDYLGSDKYIEYVKKYGFFSAVDSDGIEETCTTLDFLHFTYPSEKLSLTYGQGSSVTTLQLLQAYTAIMGNGEMVKPYFIDKVVNPDTGEIVYQREREVVSTPISQDTAKKMQELLRRCITENSVSYWRFNIDETDVIGKTGTSEIYVDGAYSTDVQLTSVLLGFPAEDPKYIVYIAFESEYGSDHVAETPIVKDYLSKIALLTNAGYVPTVIDSETEVVETTMPSVVNNSTASACMSLGNDYDVVVIGDGDYVVDQYPKAGDSVNTKSKVYLLTNGSNITLPNFTGWTRKEVINYWSLSGLSIVLDGYGMGTSQSIDPGTVVTGSDEVVVYFDYANGG